MFQIIEFIARFGLVWSMRTPLSRRRFLARAAGACAITALPSRLFSPSNTFGQGATLGFPLVDFHVHLDNSTIDKVLELSAERKVRFGIVEHAGTKENKYPVVLSNDAELKRYLAMLEGKPVYKGVQAEWIDWMSCFSAEALGQLDFVLSDAMTFPGPNGQRMKLWEKGAEIGDPQRFMDRYADWHVEVMAKEPLDILANTSWLPDAIAANYDTLWTRERMQKVIDAAVKYGVALEISSSYQLPKLPFLRLAKAGGVKFSFGSNGRYPKMGKLDYSIEMAKALDLKPEDMFTPAPPGKKPFQRRRLG
jgi:histidinol phosphatase-like PHP family hydrolase